MLLGLKGLTSGQSRKVLITMMNDDALSVVLRHYVMDYVNSAVKVTSLSSFPLVCRDFHRVCASSDNGLARLCLKYIPDFYVNTSRARVFQKRTLDRLTEEYESGSTSYFELTEEQEMCKMLLFQLFKYPIQKHIYVVRVPTDVPKSKNTRRTASGYEALLNAPLRSYYSFEQECTLVKFPRFTVSASDVFVLDVYSDKGNNLEAKTIALMELSGADVQSKMMKWNAWEDKMKRARKRKKQESEHKKKVRRFLLGF